MYYKRVLGK